jgi:hypothetical protein
VSTQESLTDADLRVAGLSMANKTQFRSNALTLPKFVGDNPKMRLITLLHTFAYHQSKFIGNVWKNSPANFVALVVAMLMAGIPLDALKRWLTGRKQNEEPLEFVVSGLSSAGGFGILFDLARSGSDGKERLVSALAGPFVSDIGAFGSALVNGFTKGAEWSMGDAEFGEIFEPISKEFVTASPYLIAQKTPTGAAIAAGMRPFVNNVMFPGTASRFQ